MNCFKPRRTKTFSPTMSSYSASAFPPFQEVLLRIPGCTVNLMDEGDSVEIARGDFTLLRVSENGLYLATIIKVGEDLQWPLTKDEPVVKLDSLHYLFSMPMKDGGPLSYGVTFSGQYNGNLSLLDSTLMELSCFSGLSSAPSRGVDWKEYAPRIDNYNGVLAKAIAGGTGQIVKGIFKCSNSYANQVQKGSEMILSCPADKKNGFSTSESRSSRNGGATKKSELNKSLKRVRKLSKMTEKLSKKMLDVAGVASGSAMGPLVRSQAGKAFLAMVPGEVLLASLDAVNTVLDAAEVAEKQAFSATSGAATRMVTERYGESAGEATGHALATCGHCAGTAWNIFKLRKAINPSSALRSAAKNRKA